MGWPRHLVSSPFRPQVGSSLADNGERAQSVLGKSAAARHVCGHGPPASEVMDEASVVDGRLQAVPWDVYRYERSQASIKR